MHDKSINILLMFFVATGLQLWFVFVTWSHVSKITLICRIAATVQPFGALELDVAPIPVLNCLRSFCMVLLALPTLNNFPVSWAGHVCQRPLPQCIQVSLNSLSWSVCMQNHTCILRLHCFAVYTRIMQSDITGKPPLYTSPWLT